MFCLSFLGQELVHLLHEVATTVFVFKILPRVNDSAPIALRRRTLNRMLTTGLKRMSTVRILNVEVGHLICLMGGWHTLFFLIKCLHAQPWPLHNKEPKAEKVTYGVKIIVDKKKEEQLVFFFLQHFAQDRVENHVAAYCFKHTVWPKLFFISTAASFLGWSGTSQEAHVCGWWLPRVQGPRDQRTRIYLSQSCS